MDTKQIGDTINLVFQVLMLVLPIATVLITWFVRNYVKSANAEKTLAAVIRVSNAAIDFAQDVDNRGELSKYLKLWNLPDNVINLTSDGLKKLNMAGKWAESEFDRMGINMTNEQAQAWIASEFQKRAGDTGPERGVGERTGDAVSLLRTLEQSGLISLPTDASQAALLASKVADWAATRVVPTGPSVETQLAQVAAQSVQYVEQLKASHQLTLPEVDIAAAWVLTEATKQGLAVTTDQIARVVRTAFESRKAG